MRKFDLRFKLKVVRDYLAGKGGYKILAAKYGIANSLVRSWVAAYQHHGSAGLPRLLPCLALYYCKDFPVPVLVEDDALGAVADREAEEHDYSKPSELIRCKFLRLHLVNKE